MDKYAPYKIIEYGGGGEIVEKKSRFIARVQATESEEEAAAFIEAEKKRYWDARHHCYAYILGEQGQTVRYSDDGEPSGTAGRPILEVLTGSGVRNVTLVVTRYFGGTLLGTGGLVRAYSGCVAENLNSAEKVCFEECAEKEYRVNYAAAEAVDYDAAYVYDRQSVRKRREKNEIGISAVRGGNIVGEHEIIFAGSQEVLELKHSALSRDVFAEGAVKAAVFMSNIKAPGLYTMKHVLAEVLGQ